MMWSQQYRPRVVLVDDHASVLRALSRFLGSTCEVVATVDNGQQAIEAAVKLKPDVMVVDLTMLEMNGLEICRRVKGGGRAFGRKIRPAVVHTAGDALAVNEWRRAPDKHQMAEIIRKLMISRSQRVRAASSRASYTI